ncbi:MAG: helix-turn-helix domain-containing protein [Fimbriiglobus sp.]
MDALEDQLSRLQTRVAELEAVVARVALARPEQEWYSTSEAAEMLGRAEWTVREWCRLKRVNAGKRRCGRGAHCEWAISRTELIRIMNEGLLPLR